MPGGFRIEVELDRAYWSTPTSAQPKPTFECANVAIWTDEPTIRIDPDTLLIGHVFSRRSPCHAILNWPFGNGSHLVAGKGGQLLGECWGGYVLVQRGGSGAVRVFRDPSGALPCYFKREAARVTCASDVALLASPASGQVNFAEVARILASGDARGRRTCITGVKELIAGECIVIRGDGIDIETWWAPWDYICPPPQADFDELALRLRATVDDCVGGWASRYASILLGISGGLDSSLVAAAAAPKAERLTCLTLFGPDFDGDERRYASALADALQLPLREMPRDVDDVDVTRAAAPNHPWPIVPLGRQTNEAIHRRIETELPIDAHFTGNGGDAILCSMRSAIPFIDRALAEGPRAGLGDTLRDICLLTGADRRTVLRRAWDRYRRHRGQHQIRYRGLGLMADALKSARAAGPTHPWLTPPFDILPGKSVHIAYLMRAQKSLELYPRHRSPPHVAPLLSQPIIELCLSIPTWMWVAGGLNRAVARRAFENRLPEAITRRTQKGGPGGFDLQIYRQYRNDLHEQLRSGLLAANGIVDPKILDGPEDPSWRGTERIQRILEFVAAENWVRHWTNA